MRHHHLEPRQRAREGERGAGLIEYALLLALIALVTFGAVSFFGGQTNGGFGKSQTCMEAAYSGAQIPAECD